MTSTLEKPTWGFTVTTTPVAKPNGHQVTSGGTVVAGETGPDVNGQAARDRREAALKVRLDAAQIGYALPFLDHLNNGDEQRYPNRIGNFTKGLPHNRLGEVVPAAYASLLRALRTRAASDFEAIQLGRGNKLTSPQAGLAFDLEGPDSFSPYIPPAPQIASAEAAGEMAELYAMALIRDLPFTHFGCSNAVAELADTLSRFSDFRGPKENGRVTPATLFRGITPGDKVGPYISQFLLLDIRYGSLEIVQRNETITPGLDYMTTEQEWLDIQNGVVVAKEPRFGAPDQRRYLRNMRDLAHYVHVDQLYEAYLNAALILLSAQAPVDEGNPYRNSNTQIGFATFGGPHLLSLVTEVATRALKAVWFQKWLVHRRLRPEAYAGLVHHQRYGADYPIHKDLIDSAMLERVYEHNQRANKSSKGTYFLPMAFPEGSPTHPAYGAGHATVAGACVTILKAWFDESTRMIDLKHPNGGPSLVIPNDDGTRLLPYSGADADKLTVGGELDKVAANIAIGRNMAGVHWRTDYTESIRLGEQVALGILQEQSRTYNEDSSFTVTTFDGERVRIQNGQQIELPCA